MKYATLLLWLSFFEKLFLLSDLFYMLRFNLWKCLLLYFRRLCNLWILALLGWIFWWRQLAFLYLEWWCILKTSCIPDFLAHTVQWMSLNLLSGMLHSSSFSIMLSGIATIWFWLLLLLMFKFSNWHWLLTLFRYFNSIYNRCRGGFCYFPPTGFVLQQGSKFILNFFTCDIRIFISCQKFAECCTHM